MIWSPTVGPFIILLFQHVSTSLQISCASKSTGSSCTGSDDSATSETKGTSSAETWNRLEKIGTSWPIRKIASREKTQNPLPQWFNASQIQTAAPNKKNKITYAVTWWTGRRFSLMDCTKCSLNYLNLKWKWCDSTFAAVCQRKIEVVSLSLIPLKPVAQTLDRLSNPGKNRTMDVSHHIEPVGKQFQTCKATKYGKTRQNQRTSKI